MIRVTQKGRPVTTVVVVVVNLCFTSLFGTKGLLRSQQSYKVIARDIVQLYMYAARQTAEFPHKTLSRIGICIKCQ